MQAEAAQKLIKKIIDIVEKDGLAVEKLSPLLLELREFAKQEEDPLVTKILRLMAEYLNENEAFDLEPEMPVEEADEDDEFEFEEPEEEEKTAEEHVVYLMQLISKSQNPYNREEIKAYRKELWDSIY